MFSSRKQEIIFEIIFEKFGIEKFKEMYFVFSDEKDEGIQKEVLGRLMWIVEIRYESATGILAYLRTDNFAYSVLVPFKINGKNIELENISPISMANFTDPVSATLQNINLVNDSIEEIWGYGMYSLYMSIYTVHTTTFLEYHNGPDELNAPSMNKLWDSIQLLVNYIVAESRNRQLTQFVTENWWGISKRAEG